MHDFGGYWWTLVATQDNYSMSNNGLLLRNAPLAVVTVVDGCQQSHFQRVQAVRTTTLQRQKKNYYKSAITAFSYPTCSPLVVVLRRVIYADHAGGGSRRV